MRHAILVVALLLVCFVSTSFAQEAPRRTNLIFIVTDDQAAWSIGAYGNKESQTVNQDRLAREGAIFLNAFTPTPVCSPSRATMMTGRYGTQVGITDWLHPVEADVNGQGLPTQLVTWPAVLKRNGYATALFGKWHLGTKPQYHPTKFGYDHFFGILDGGDRPIDATLDFPDGEKVVKGPMVDALTSGAIDFVRAHKDRPFAVSIHYREPHLPYYPVLDEDSAPYKNLDPTIPDVKGNDAKQIKEWTRRYYGSIHSVDRNLGRLLDELDKLKLAENTVVVFTSDHGYNIGHHNLHTKGNGWWVAGGQTESAPPRRTNMFDTSIRVPLIVRWPGVVKPGTKVPQLVSLVDTFPSVLGMLGVAAPAEAKHHGADFTPLLRGESPADWRDAVFGQYDVHNGAIDFMRMSRTDRYKLVRHHLSNGMNEFYDLQDDPGELKNLWGDKRVREERDRLVARLEQWQKSIDDPILSNPLRKFEFDGTDVQP